MPQHTTISKEVESLHIVHTENEPLYHKATRGNDRKNIHHSFDTDIKFQLPSSTVDNAPLGVLLLLLLLLWLCVLYSPFTGSDFGGILVLLPLLSNIVGEW